MSDVKHHAHRNQKGGGIDVHACKQGEEEGVRGWQKGREYEQGTKVVA
jgi:hypothetical protein